MKLNITDKFTTIQNAIREARNEAQREAKTHYAVVRSRGVWLSASANGETITDGQENYFKSRKELITTYEFLLTKGADQFFIEGGFDGADSVNDFNDCAYESWITEWTIEIQA